MSKFIYTAKNQAGQSKGGEISGPDEKSVAQQLRSEGFLVTSMRQIGSDDDNKKPSVSFIGRFQKVPLKEKMVFARNLSIMISSGLPITKAISNLDAQMKNKQFKKILKDIYENMQQGKTLSESLAAHPSVFNDLFVNMVKVGETGGNLEEVLNIVAVQMEKEYELMSKVRGALIYPAVIMVAMIGVAILMLTFILPKITSVFKDMDVELPATTRGVMAISDFMVNNMILVAVGFVIMGIFFKFFLQTETGKKALSLFVILFPLTKNIVVKANCARFARIYSSLLRSGVPVIEGLTIISQTLTNYYYRRKISSAIEGVQKGQDLSALISGEERIFPPLVSQMIEVGEQTGKTEAVLLKLAEFYEEEVNQITKNMSSVIEPALMLLIGGAVGFFAVAMLQPMYGLLENIQ